MLPDYELPDSSFLPGQQSFHRYSLKSSIHCRAVEAAQSHPARFPRNSHNQSVKLEFVDCSATGYGFVCTGLPAATDPRRAGNSRRINLGDLLVSLALKLDGSSAVPHHPYPKPITAAERRRTCRRSTQRPLALPKSLKLVFQEKNISVWQKN